MSAERHEDYNSFSNGVNYEVTEPSAPAPSGIPSPEAPLGQPGASFAKESSDSKIARKSKRTSSRRSAKGSKEVPEPPAPMQSSKPSSDPPLAQPGASFVKESADSKFERKSKRTTSRGPVKDSESPTSPIMSPASNVNRMLLASMNASGDSYTVGTLTEPDAIRPGTVTSVMNSSDSKINRKLRANMNMSGSSIDSVDTTSEPEAIRPGTVTSVKNTSDSKIGRKIRASMNASGSSIDSVDTTTEPDNVMRPGTVTSVKNSPTSKLNRKLRASDRAGSGSAAGVGATASTGPDTKLAKKLSAAGPREARDATRGAVVVQNLARAIDSEDAEDDDDEEPSLIQPGTVSTVMTNDSKNSKIAAKIAAAGVGASAAKDDSRVARKASRAGANVGAVQAEGDDPARSKKEAQSHFVQNDLFLNEDNEQEINPDDYLQQQVRSLRQEEAKKKLPKTGTDGLGSVIIPKAPGAYSVKGARTGGWFTGGFMQRSRRMGNRAQSGVVTDSGIAIVTGELILEEKTCWEAVDKTALYAGGFLLVVVILAISIPLALVSSAPPPPTMAPTSSRLAVFDEFYTAIANISGDQALQDPESPQSMALDWIVYSDQLNLDVEDPTMIQRYSLMCLYFGSEGDNWKYRTGIKWGSGVSECEWDYVTCIENTVDKVQLSQVGMKGTLVSELTQLTKLSLFDVSKNVALGEAVFPTVITQMENLAALNVEETGMGGILPDAIGGMTNLLELNLQNNEFIGSLPETMKGLTNLVFVSFLRNQLKGPVFDFATNWRELTSLDISENEFTSSIPSEIGLLTKLTGFHAYITKLTGTLPTELGLLTDMEDFNLGSGSGGTLQSELGRWTKLKQFQITNAKLSGSIPTSFGLFGDLLNIFSLNSNSLTGTIPSELGLLKSVDYFDVSSNLDLTGLVPTQLGSITALTTLKLQGTRVSGTMPAEICNLRKMVLGELWAECFGGAAKIECAYPECCTNCQSR